MHDPSAAAPTLENLTNALEHIRIAALLHYVGGAFDPEHMRSICNIASDALDGKPIPPLPDPYSATGGRGGRNLGCLSSDRTDT